MGKANRKMKKRIQQREMSELEKEVSRHMEAEEYEEVINVLAEISKSGKMSPENMYDGAYAYFMCGDYERSAMWIGNTLQFAPSHIPARILLARVCILQNRTEEGLAIFDLLLGRFFDALSDDQKDEIEELVEFYGRNDSERIAKDHPNIARFLHIAEYGDKRTETAAADAPVEKAPEAAVDNSSDAADQGRKSPVEILRALKAKISAAKERAGEVVEEAAAKVREKVEPERPGEETPEQTELPFEAGEQKRSAPTGVAVHVKAHAKPQAPPSEAEAKKAEILAQDRSLAEKIRLLNRFAGAYYYSGDTESAKHLLKAALTLDEHDDESLGNMAVALAETGDRETAVKLVSQMSRTDFLLLQKMRGH